MKYFSITIGVDSIIYGNDTKITEITEQKFETFKKYYEKMNLYYYMSPYKYLFKDFNPDNVSGYVTAVATDDNLNEVKEISTNLVKEFLQDCLDKRMAAVDKLNKEIENILNHPILLDY